MPSNPINPNAKNTSSNFSDKSVEQKRLDNLKDQAPSSNRMDRSLEQQRLDNLKAQTTMTDQQSSTTLNDQQRIEAFKDQEQRIPVVQESVQVGKREVDRGGVRVQSKLVETNFDEDVTLRQEHVQVERHAVNRPVAPGDMTAFREGQIEVRERAEEAVVAKEARVVEEVVIGKTVGQEVKHIHDTLRHTEVAIDRLGGQLKTGNFKPYDYYATGFRQNYDTNFASSGLGYDRYEPLYRYGYNLATSQQFGGKDWTTVENDARGAWEEKNPGTWDQVKNTVKHAWDKVTGKA